jgi:hypothetical protein
MCDCVGILCRPDCPNSFQYEKYKKEKTMDTRTTREIDWDDLRDQKKQLETQELVLICARDIVNAWPHTTMRTLGEMTKRMDTLRQALEAAGK